MERIKFGYLYYSEILERMNNGDIGAYDVVYTKDTHQTIFITPNHELLPIQSKVYTYSSIVDAETALNNNFDTYIGQMVSIYSAELSCYRAYIVNLIDGIYRVTAIAEQTTEVVDYNRLGNRPLTNLDGNEFIPIVLSNLSNGNYMISGTYKIYPEAQTVYSTGYRTFVDIMHNQVDNNIIYIKIIMIDAIIDCVYDNGNLITNNYITDTILDAKNYTTQTYVDNAINTLHTLISEEVRAYVQQTVNEIIDGRQATIDDIKNLFK